MQEQTQPPTEHAPQRNNASRPAAREVPDARWSRLSWRLAIRFVVVALVGILAVWLVVNLQTLLMEIFLAIVLTTGLSTVKQSLQGYGLPRLAAILLIVLLVLALVAIIGVFVIPALLGQTATFVRQLPALARSRCSPLGIEAAPLRADPRAGGNQAAVVLVRDTNELDFTQHPKSTGLATDWRSSGARSAFASCLGSRPYNAGDAGIRASGAIDPPNCHSRGIAQRRRRGKETEEWSCCAQVRGPTGSSKQFSMSPILRP